MAPCRPHNRSAPGLQRSHAWPHPGPRAPARWPAHRRTCQRQHSGGQRGEAAHHVDAPAWDGRGAGGNRDWWVRTCKPRCAGHVNLVRRRCCRVCKGPRLHAALRLLGWLTRPAGRKRQRAGGWCRPGTAPGWVWARVCTGRRVALSAVLMIAGARWLLTCGSGAHARADQGFAGRQQHAPQLALAPHLLTMLSVSWMDAAMSGGGAQEGGTVSARGRACMFHAGDAGIARHLLNHLRAP